MLKNSKIIKKSPAWIALSVILAFFLSLCIPFSYVYWGKNYKYHTLGITIGNFSLGGGLADRLPPNTPSDVLDKLEQIAELGDAAALEALINAVESIVDTPEFDGANIHLGDAIENLFYEDGISVGAGDFLIYTATNEHGELVYTIIYASQDLNYWRPIDSLEALNDALSADWTNIEIQSTTWQRGNYYSVVTAPVEHEGKWYVPANEGMRGDAPSTNRGRWHEIIPDLEHCNDNRYFKNEIVKKFNQYYVATSYATWAAPTENPAPWYPWQIIPQFSANSSYAPSSIVHTINYSTGKARFWVALTQNSVFPDENSARQGIWQEVKNAWIGRGDEVASFYFPHNTYKSGDIVVDGITITNNYKYYRAKTDVPPNEPPTVRGEDGINRISDYWESIYFVK